MRRIRGSKASLAIVTVVLAGCGSAGTSSGTPPTLSDQTVLQSALAAWADFPVNASPRPLVLPDWADQQPAGGALSVANVGQLGEGAIDPPPTLPSTPTEADGYRLITAGQAFRELSAGNGHSPSATRIQTTSVALGTATFYDDRGAAVQLPVWVFTFVGGVTGSDDVLAVSPPSLYPIPAPLTVRSGLSLIYSAKISPGRADPHRGLGLDRPAAPAPATPATASGWRPPILRSPSASTCSRTPRRAIRSVPTWRGQTTSPPCWLRRSARGS